MFFVTNICFPQEIVFQDIYKDSICKGKRIKVGWIKNVLWCQYSVSHGILLNAFWGGNLHVLFNTFLMLNRFPSSLLKVSLAFVGGC